MKCYRTGEWPSTEDEALEQQRQAGPLVSIIGHAPEPNVIVAVDTSYGSGGSSLYVAAVATTFPGLSELERAYYEQAVTFPYIPGFFYYREGPAICAVLEKMRTQADLILLASHGIAHPARCGLACQVGIDFGRPTIGCSRKLLAGQVRPVANTKGSSQPILLDGKTVGVAYRSKDDVKPIFISPGHLCDVPYAQQIAVPCLRGFRMPEPLRLAHILANRHRRRSEAGWVQGDSDPPNGQ